MIRLVRPAARPQPLVLRSATFPLDGFTADVSIADYAGRALGPPPQKNFPVRPVRKEAATGLIDTGASHTVIDVGFVRKLSLRSTGSLPVSTLGGFVTNAAERMTGCAGKGYLVNIQFQNLCWIEECFVGVAPLLGVRPYDCIIGRDILSLLNFEFSRVNKTLELRF